MKKTIMKAAITGATGFIGKNLADNLTKHGFEIICFTRPHPFKRADHQLPYPRRILQYHDVTTLVDAVKDVHYLFHVAGLTRGRTWEEYEEANVETTKNLLQAISMAKSDVRRFVYVSSQTACGPTCGEKPTDENVESHPIPNDWYGNSKLMAEKIVMQYQKEIPVTIIRPPAVYGPYDKNFLGLFKTVCKYRIMPVIYPPTREFTIVHVSDLVNGIRMSITSEKSIGKTYFIGGQNITYTTFIEAFEDALQKHIYHLYIPVFIAKIAGEIGELKWILTGRSSIVCRRKIRDLLQSRWVCSWHTAELDFEYHPKIELVDGIRQTIQWYKEAGWF